MCAQPSCKDTTLFFAFLITIFFCFSRFVADCVHNYQDVALKGLSRENQRRCSLTRLSRTVGRSVAVWATFWIRHSGRICWDCLLGSERGGRFWGRGVFVPYWPCMIACAGIGIPQLYRESKMRPRFQF